MSARRRWSSPEDNQPRKKLNAQGLRELGILLAYLKPHRLRFALGLLCLLGSSLASLAFPRVTGQLVDAAAGKGSGSLDINTIALGLLGMLSIQAVFSFFRIRLFVEVGERSLAGLRRDLYSRLVDLPLSFYARNRVGDIVSRVSNDISTLHETLTTTLAELLRGTVILIVGVGAILAISVKLTGVMLATFPIIIGVGVVFGRYIRRIARQATDRLAEAGVVLEETLQGIQSVKAFTNENYERKRYGNAIEQVVAAALKGGFYRGAFASFIILALLGAFVLVMWYGTHLLEQQELTVGGLTSFLIYTLFVGASMGGFSEHYAQLQKTVGATERVRQLLAEDVEHRSNDDAATAPTLPARLSGAMAFRDVHFAYPSRSELQVLRGMSFDLKPGEKVALVGSSGAGKSTIMQLILRFYLPDAGQILVDGRPAQDYPLAYLRGQMALVPQDVLLFGGTIRENILYGRLNASDAEVLEAARQANALEFIDRFPEGLDTVVGERGLKLSGGQRQRIAIARAVLRNPAILLLDEATSSLDSESEQLVQAALDRLMEGRTTLVIAHRLSTVRNADRILVLNQGMLSEEGTHEELMQLPQGLYRSLATMQFDTQAV